MLLAKPASGRLRSFDPAQRTSSYGLLNLRAKIANTAGVLQCILLALCQGGVTLTYVY